jgi:hypothetical protein
VTDSKDRRIEGGKEGDERRRRRRRENEDEERGRRMRSRNGRSRTGRTKKDEWKEEEGEEIDCGRKLIHVERAVIPCSRYHHIQYTPQYSLQFILRQTPQCR